MSTWTAVTVSAPVELEDALASFLIDRGAPGLETTQTGPVVELTAHFADAPPLAELERFCDMLPELFPGCQRPEIRCREVADDDWAENWKAHFPPLAVGERLYVHPPWVREVPDGRLGIEIHPGMAFGTGHHPSTRGCLRLLETVSKESVPSRVLDLGTGSGILAIAASKLGAGDVWAVDTDADACRIAAENAARNRLREPLRFAADLAAVPGTFDLVLANLFARQLAALAGSIFALLREGGTVVGSGVLDSEAAAVRAAWLEAGLVPREEQTEEGWTTLAFRRSSTTR